MATFFNLLSLRLKPQGSIISRITSKQEHKRIIEAVFWGISG